MKFLGVSRIKHLIPPKEMIGIVDAMQSWLQRYKENIEQSCGFTDSQGGGETIKVESSEDRYA